MSTINDLMFSITSPLLERIQGPITLVFSQLNGVKNKRDEEFDAVLFSLVKEALSDFTTEDLKNDPVVRAYRDFYWRVCKIDPTKTRPAGEALARRVIAGKPLPNISRVVNAYNVASAITRISLGAYDITNINPPLQVRNAQEGEEFLGIGMKKPVKLNHEHLVLADEIGAFNILPYRDAERTKIKISTSNVLLVGIGVPGVSIDLVKNAVQKATTFILESVSGQFIGSKEFVFTP